MKSLSTIASNVQASTTLALDALYKEMKANGVDVIGFAAGEPDFPTPDYIKYAGMAAIVHDETRYTPATGTLALKKAVCKRLKEDLGAKHCLYIALRAIINPGDEVIIPTPAWVTYNEMVKMVGAEPVTIVCTEAENFKLTPEKLEAAITDKTKCVMLNNPSNPTGMLYSREELQGIADVCVKHDLFIIKSYAMTGWRIGYIAADKRVVSVMSKYLSHSTGNPSAPAQAASVVALNAPQDTVEEMRKAFEKRRDYMVERMNQIPGVSCLKPEGAFYVMMNISKLIGADDFGDIFLKEGLVCIVPCTGFGDPNFLRWSYATSMENIKEGLDRLERFLAE